MSRSMPVGFEAGLSASVVYGAILVELEWPSGTVRVWNGYSDLSWDSKTWVGVGHLGSISEIGESPTERTGVQLALSGVPSSVISQALENNSQGKPARIWFGKFEAGVFDAARCFEGVIDVCSIDGEGENRMVTVTLEKELYDDRSSARRYTHEDQQMDYPGDLGLEYVAALANRQFTWGRITVSPAGGGGAAPDSGELE